MQDSSTLPNSFLDLKLNAKSIYLPNGNKADIDFDKIMDPQSWVLSQELPSSSAGNSTTDSTKGKYVSFSELIKKKICDMSFNELAAATGLMLESLNPGH